MILFLLACNARAPEGGGAAWGDWTPGETGAGGRGEVAAPVTVDHPPGLSTEGAEGRTVAVPDGADGSVAQPRAGAPGPVVVIGAGAAGLAAAHEIGGDVVLIEVDTEAGGRALWSGGYLLLADTPELAADGREFSTADLVEDWEVLTGSPATDLTRAYLEDTPALRDRLSALGLAFELGHQDPIFHRYFQHHVVGSGVALVDALVADLPADGELQLGVAVTGLRFEGGRVVGVDTTAGPVDAGTVVIASGGFVHRSDLLERFTSLPPGSWGASTDDGGWGAAVGWAREYGLGLVGVDAIGWNANLLGIPAADGSPMGVVRSGMPPWVWVDGSGARFVDESAGWSLTLAAQVARHGDVWAVVSWEELNAAVDAVEVAPLEAARAAGRVVCGDDAFLLARALGVAPGTLERSLGEVATVRAAGGVDTLGRAGSTMPALTGELCGIRVGRLAAKNYGGVATDPEGRVLDADGIVVPGLYAAGEACGMGGGGLGGRFGFDGSLGAVVWSGWRTGRTVATDRTRDAAEPE